ncbi:4-alpha-glucanotransferase [Cellulosilyticum lentocellum]|uniref:4-alpha-glucanotransferase n=1 Tax=Cellulosilyticum lentocellum (strain ATCC 49066 / DSM 5427 / NCIMB 11756 / RHM5) TaxID=642492 RepID=F2JIP8_CELLD|nr:4-alpha-glucanotransferase [Cellulosilyticum lentocellum]ADZ85518.1 4-alpha-glucanotransferase [Cellulosilyticum lentocellum DSM 5427]
MSRKSGIIMHISSLSEKYGIGSFGKKAYEFADFLKEAGQSYWQILPLGPTSYGDSPYQSFSAFAGNPYFVDLETLEKEGLLKPEDYVDVDFGSDEFVDYEKLFTERNKVLHIAYKNSKGKLTKQIEAFKKENASWLKDYAMYMAIKFKMELRSWQEWDEDIKLRKPEVMKAYEKELKDEIEYWIFVQYEFYKQWEALKSYVNSLGIKIIGDIPIYVSADSSDAWANDKLFKLDENKNPIFVAGCPPDAFSDDGQLWGNPIYDWDYLEETGYEWWIERLKASLKLYDVIRIDHFRGFESYWQIPFGHKTAKKGKWVKGPGIKLFKAVKEKLGDIDVIAEDLGYMTDKVINFRDKTGYPGMKVLQFAFDTREESDYLPHNYTRNCVVYTGTHDNDTVMGWIDTTGNPEDVKNAKHYLKLDICEGYHWGFIRGAWSSVADTAIAQMQDFLGLGNEARMNLPSTLGGNWQWRIKDGALTKELAKRIYDLTKMYGRLEEDSNE